MFGLLGLGKRGNRWSQITIRVRKMHRRYSEITWYTFFYVVLVVFVRGPAAYEALKEFRLPARRTLQAHTRCFLHEGGVSWNSIAKQVELFQQFKASQKAQENHLLTESSFLMMSRSLHT